MTSVTQPALPLEERKRLNELLSFNILDTAREKEFDTLTTMAAHLCGVPVSMINFVDTNRQWTKSSQGIDIYDSPRSGSVCEYTIHGKNILEIEDLSKDDRFKKLPYVADEPHFKFYAGAPLITKRGLALGSLCVFDTKTNKLTDTQREDLKALAGEVVTQLELRKQEDEFKKLDKRKDIILRLVSHDIRNPLAGIMGAAELLLDDFGIHDLQAREMIQLIRENSERIKEIVADLLDDELIMSGNLPLNLANCNPVKIINDLVDTYKLTAKNKKIELSLSVDAKNEIPEVFIDSQKYHRIVANLVSNAIKFTPRDGEISVSMSYEPENTHLGTLVTSVKDSGIGIPAELLPNLFKWKKGRGRPGTQNETSYGLGLPMVKRLCDVCDTDISVDSVENQGSTFTIHMPAEKEKS